jgi:ribonuclease III
MSSAPSPIPVAQALGLEFHDHTLLQRAFIHRSYLNELLDEHEDLSDNERLEFLGDAVLSYVVSERLYALFPIENEGDLTNLRSALVRRETLARLAVELQLGDYLFLGHGEEESGGRTRPATLCGTFEALLGAVYLDLGIEAVKQAVFTLLDKDIARLQAATHTKDPKSRLQEHAQATFNFTPRYKVAESIGPDHAKHFVMLVLVNGRAWGVGQGRSKQEAAQQAAAMALHRAHQLAPEYVPNAELEARHPLDPIPAPPDVPPGLNAGAAADSATDQ